MTLVALGSVVESTLVKRISSAMSVMGRRNFAEHVKIDGFPPQTIEEYTAALSLWHKGWLYEEPNMLKMTPLRFSEDAWQRFSTAETDALEEEAIMKKRGDDFGSWS